MITGLTAHHYCGLNPRRIKGTLLCISFLFIFANPVFAQNYHVSDDFLIINAGKNAPVYTTYTAAMERSSLYGDKGYKMIYDDDHRPICYGSEHGGNFCNIWEINNVVVDQTGYFHQKPVVRASFPDMAILDYQPWPGLEVEEAFFVYSSGIALVECSLTNNSAELLGINIYPVLQGADSLRVIKWIEEDNSYLLHHYETKLRLISNLPDKYPYPVHLADILQADFIPYSHGAYNGTLDDFYRYIKTDFYAENRSDSLNLLDSGYVDLAALHGKFSLRPGESARFRYGRALHQRDSLTDGLMAEVNNALKIDIQPFIDKNVALFANIPRIEFERPEERMMYLSAFNLARGCMLPPSGETSYNHYVFSREPLWGWGHGHQVLHESLSMLAYVYLDPVSAQNSQRVYMEQQGDDGLIAYRHGPRGPQTYPHKNMPTTSAPFFSWINWEIYKVSMDKIFLEEAYESGVKYTNWLIKNRDADKDGTFEWGPYGIIENVRDWYNAVFQVSAERYLDVDKEDISDELECLDLSLMMVKEMRCLAEMAAEMNLKKESGIWKERADQLSKLINERMWDKESRFFYSVNKADHGFYFMTRDLRREEIIGFLPLWAKAVSYERADELIEKLTDPAKFWRKFGVPTLAADDEWYSPYVDYCCKWNGPVWLLWDYMVFEGLKNYGYDDLAAELSDKMINAVELQLSRNHNFWESYSPDNEVLNCPPNYIWDAIIAKMMIDRSSY
jgi:hypothetical protein